jgi:hypothetical protein
MATTIKLKNGSGAPLAGDLVAGEPALDLTNKRLYTEDSGGTVIEVGTNPTSLTTGTFTSTGIDDNATSTAITIDSSENVGIGTASPAGGATRIVDVYGSSSSAINFHNATSGTTATDGGVVGQYGNDLVLFNYEAGIIQLGTSNTERMRIDSSGRVGIGTDSPAQQLEISGTGAIKQRYTRSSNSTDISLASSGMFNADNLAATGFGWYNNGSEAMRIDSSGNVGIGTTSPSAKTHIYDATTDAVLYFDSGSANGSHARFLASGSVKHFFGSGGGFGLGDVDDFGFRAFDNLLFSTGNSSTERMRIDSSGNVGIGTTSPSRKFHVNSGTANAVSVFESTDATAYIQLKDTGGSGAVGTTGAGNGLRFWLGDAATEAMRITSAGDVGIGTASPSKTLHVNSGASTDIAQFSSNAASFVFGASTGLISMDLGATDAYRIRQSGSERMRIDSSGLVLAGVTSSTYHTFSLNNSGNYAAGVVNTNPSAPYGLVISLSGVSSGGGAGFLTCVDGNANRLLIRGDGDVENVNNSYGAISDERVKSNIVDASSQIDDIMAVQVRSYTLNETGDTHIGVVAQELEASGMSGLVQEDDEGMKSVKYSILYMKAIKALQEAVTRIETLEAEVAALKGA